MSRKVKAESDGWWRQLLQEMLEVEKGSDTYLRVTIMPGKSHARLEISAELWQNLPHFGPVRVHTYKREWPHSDHNYLSGACWLAALAVLRMQDEEKMRSEASDK